MSGELMRAALGYAGRLGWPVLPCRGKVPLCERGVHDATTTAWLIREWWKKWPTANIGIACGAVSGFVALDVDPRHGGDVSLEELEAAHGALPETVVQLTGGGGRHILFQYPGWNPRNSTGVLGPGLDVKAHDSYIIAAPSSHPDSGRLYSWSGDARPLEVEIAPLPAWLADLLREPATKEKKALPPEEWARLASEKVSHPDRTKRLVKLAGHLFRRDVDQRVVLELLLAWNVAKCCPPHEDEHVVATVNGIAECEKNRRKGTA